MTEKFNDFLMKQEEDDMLRTLNTIESNEKTVLKIKDKSYIDFSSNDYLSIAGHPYLKEVSIEFLKKYGTSARASRLLSGNYEYHVLLEERIAKLKEKEAGLIFGNGYLANTTVLPALVDRDDVIFADKLVHASLIDGIILARSKFFRFEHNNTAHLEELLRRERSKYKNVIIVTESIFSMDGDRALLPEIAEVKKKYNCLLYVDEAHATGVFGPHGAGLVEEAGLANKCDIIMGTFGKALGSYGAYITTSEQIKQYLVNRARGFIFSTAMPPAVVGASLAAIELLEKEPFRREKLLEKSRDFREKLVKAGLKIPGDSQIIPVLIGDTKQTINIAEKLKEKGFYVLPIRPPTVPDGTARLRLSLVYDHTAEALDSLVKELSALMV